MADDKGVAANHLDDVGMTTAVETTSNTLSGVTERNVASRDGQTHEESTFSPELTNALAQEYAGFWTKDMLKLVPIVTVGFLSQSAPARHRPLVDQRPIRLLHEWLRRFNHVGHQCHAGLPESLWPQ